MNLMNPGRPAWAATPFHAFICDIFPAYRTKRGVLDIRRLSSDLGKNYQGVYKWFNRERISPDSAKLCHDLANTRDNVAALKDAGLAPPKLEDFTRFVIA